MHTLHRITQIDDAAFVSMYEGNKSQLTANIGYDNIDVFKATFNAPDPDDLLFKSLDENQEVSGYFIGEPSADNTAYMYNMITKASDTLPLTVEKSADILKSLGFVNVEFCVKKGTGTYDYTKASMSREDLYQFISESTEVEGYCRVKLLLI
tara:strand:+ start:5667 stop:6122 length:456 start_codon:yes stop_codon:yes gene_type:complete